MALLMSAALRHRGAAYLFAAAAALSAVVALGSVETDSRSPRLANIALIVGVLMALNLLPILPLDGGRILSSLLPLKQAQLYARTEAFGLIIVVLLLVTGLLGAILHPLVDLTIELLPASDVVNKLLPVILSPARS